MLQILLCLLCVPFLIDAFRRSDIARCDSTDLAIWFALTILIFGALALTKNLPEGISLHYSGAAFLVEGTGVLSVVLSDHTAWGLLLASGEATLEGMILSTLVAFYPKAVVLFDDAFYLADS